MKPLEERLQNGEEARWGIHAPQSRLQRYRRRQDQDREEQPVLASAIRILGRLRRLRRNALYQSDHPVVRSPDDYRQRDRLLVDLRRLRTVVPLLLQRQRFRPAWANSLFEDNAEFGLGILSGVAKQRERLCILMREAIENGSTCSAELKSVMTEWIDNRKDATKSEEIAERLIPMMEACNCPICQQILELKHYLIKKVDLDHRRRRLGLRHRIRRSGPRHRIGQERKHPGSRHRSLFEHRRTVVEEHPDRRRRQIRVGRQARPQERPRSDGNDL